MGYLYSKPKCFLKSLLDTFLLVMPRFRVEGSGVGMEGGIGRPVLSLNHLKKSYCVTGSSSLILNIPPGSGKDLIIAFTRSLRCTMFKNLSPLPSILAFPFMY